jgi:hypothetical protein
MQKRDLAARIVGLAVFALGIGILFFSFRATYKLFTSPNGGITVAPTTPGGPPAVANLGNSALHILLMIGLLFLMVLAGSLVGNLGVKMYFAGDRQAKTEE